ncbi:T9SS type A sorting domain-containing protein [Hymenobacter humi]|uniref:T9SS type A sorting domain-containing protein n=1 Tax=Hymenobacter humi TaxID=1411620 RepID=A0ABW2UBJ4_9BACT
MRITSMVNTNSPFPCFTNILNAEVEDYRLLVQPLATREAVALPSLSLFPNPTPDGRVHLRLVDAKAAGQYAAEVQNLLGSTVLRTSLRLTPATDTELDLSTLAPGVYLLHLRDAQGQTAVRRVVRQ